MSVLRTWSGMLRLKPSTQLVGAAGGCGGREAGEPAPNHRTVLGPRLELAEHADRAERDPVYEKIRRRQVDLLTQLECGAARVGDAGRLVAKPRPGELELFHGKGFEHRPDVLE